MTWFLVLVIIMCLLGLAVAYYYYKVVNFYFELDKKVPRDSPFLPVIKYSTIAIIGLTIISLFLFYWDLCYSETQKACISISYDYFARKLGSQLAPNLVAGAFEALLIGLIFTVTWYYFEKSISEPERQKDKIEFDRKIEELKSENKALFDKLEKSNEKIIVLLKKPRVKPRKPTK